MANYISILVVWLFFFNSFICDTFSHDVLSWWTLRTNLYAIIFGLAIYLTTLKQTRFSEFICYVGLGFAVSDVIDRVVFDCNHFTWTDILMIILTILTSYYKVYVRQGR